MDTQSTPHDEVRKLIRHRLGARRRCSLRSKSGGAVRLATLVLDAYDDVSPKLHPVAQRSLFAHLEKLEVEGKGGTGEDWIACA